MRAAVRGWSPVIMIDADAGAARLADRDRGLLARRVDDADRADEDQVALERLGGLRHPRPDASGR